MMKTRLLALVGAATLGVAACSSAGSGGPSRQTSATNSTRDTSASSTPVDADLGSGTVAGKPFTSTAQFVQFDTLANLWRLHIVDGEHSCADDLASIRPAVGIDFLQPTEQAATPPRIGTHEGLGVVFIPADRTSTNGPATTTDGVTLTVEHNPLDPGQRWTGHLTVKSFDVDGLTNTFDGRIDAEVCPTVTS